MDFVTFMPMCLIYIPTTLSSVFVLLTKPLGQIQSILESMQESLEKSLVFSWTSMGFGLRSTFSKVTSDDGCLHGFGAQLEPL